MAKKGQAEKVVAILQAKTVSTLACWTADFEFPTLGSIINGERTNSESRF